MSKKKKNKRRVLKWILMVLIFVLPISLIILLSIPIATTFNLSVNTELLEYEVTDQVNSELPIKHAVMYNSDTDSIGVFYGTFKLAVGSTVNIQRIGFGPMSIRIEGKNGQSAGNFKYLSDEQSSKPSSDYIEFVYDNIENNVLEGVSYIVPITGNVELGRNVSFETLSSPTALLRNGSVVVIGKSLLSNDYYKSATHELNIGDEFRIIEPQSKAYGFATVNENVGMTVAYKVIGKEGRILTPGPRDENSGYPIALSYLSKIENDSFFKGISLCIAFLISLASLIPFIAGFYGYKN
ncbi:hypothetical protein [uncultured Winogradskyella sp.]|uniref:hypothetical protein n=1 Tax=uncultured Winogradskyella sp. TaxID=395353 RepID=UPI0026323245|nr:hypothetical protein [uncultured Winogradskyella sp.]